MRQVIVLLIVLYSVPVFGQLPVRKVVLYKHGIGYFLRSGELGSGQSARLSFDTNQMNDVLKSLTLSTQGGSINGLRFDSSDLLEHKLSRFPFELNGSMTALLNQLRGSAVVVRTGSESLTGTVVGAREVTVGANDTDDQNKPRAFVRDELTLLLDSGDLRTLNLAAVSSLRFVDSTLQAQLKDYLSDVASDRSREKRSLYIDGDGTRHVDASYIVSVPVWKTSYRVVLRDGQKPLLEGWAIVNNTGDDDWNNVRLSLVSGRPVSFISQLYEPRYLQRTVMQLPEDNSLVAELHDSAMEEAKAQPEAGYGQGAGMAGGVGGVPFAAQQAAAPTASRGRLAAFGNAAASSVTVNTQAAPLGELYEYRFSKPVTIPHGQSAMLPFIQQAIEGRKVLIFTNDGSANPRNAVELTNSTDKTLDGGPITIYDDGAYGGEALMATLVRGDKRLVSYAADLGTRISSDIAYGPQVVRAVHFRNGVLTARTAIRETYTYTVRNAEPKRKTLLLEHPIQPQFKLLNQTPKEQTANVYRFELALEPESTQKFPVAEEQLVSTTTEFSNLTPDLILTYVHNTDLPDTTRQQLQRVLDIKQQLVTLDRQIERVQREMSEHSDVESSLRQNINTLNRLGNEDAQLRKYIAQLASEDEQLEALRARLNDLRNKRASAQAALDDLASTMEF